MKTIVIAKLDGIKPDYQKDIFEAMRSCDNKERLLVCLYLMSDLGDEDHHMSQIEQNLRKIFPPSLKQAKTPDDYEDFQAAMIRFPFNMETRQVKQRQLSIERRLWENKGRGCWCNTALGNQEAVNILLRQGLSLKRVVSDSVEVPVTPSLANSPVDSAADKDVRNKEAATHVQTKPVLQEQPVNSEKAFVRLLTDIQTALRASIACHNEAVQRGDFDEVELEVDRQKNLVAARDQIQSLQELWPTLVGNLPSSSPKMEAEKVQPVKPKEAKRRKGQQKLFGDRLPKGVKTHEREFWVPILIALEEMEGRGEVMKVLERVESLMIESLNEFDRGFLKKGQLRWYNTAQWARQRMKDEGLIASDSPNGIWEITEQGRIFLQNNR